MKKILSVIVLLSISLSSVFAFSDEEQGKAANFLASKSFIKDFASNVNEYRLKDNITRKEAMKIIANVAYLKVENKCEGKFKDVADDWGCKYIESAVNAGFINKADKFRPDDNITVAEVLKLVFKARNLDRKYNTSDWASDYVNSAFDLGLIDMKPTTDGNVQFNPNKANLALIDDEFKKASDDVKRGFIFVVTARSFSDFPDINDKNFILYSDEAKIK